MTRDEALDLLHSKMQNPNLRRHCYAVEAVMKALARKFGESAELWGLAGLLHDADYEYTKSNPKQHTHMIVNWIRELNADQKIINAILAHGWKFVEGNPEPKNNMEWSLYTCDELTGLIVAVALVKDRKLKNVTTEGVLKKFPKKDFAAGVHREQIKLCEEKLKIPLNEFISIAIAAMKTKSQELGL